MLCMLIFLASQITRVMSKKLLPWYWQQGDPIQTSSSCGSGSSAPQSSSSCAIYHEIYLLIKKKNVLIMIVSNSKSVNLWLFLTTKASMMLVSYSIHICIHFTTINMIPKEPLNSWKFHWKLVLFAFSNGKTTCKIIDETLRAF